MSQVIESMFQIEVVGYEIRVWRQEEKVKDRYHEDNSDIRIALSKLTLNPKKGYSSPPKQEVIDAIVRCGRVNAVEVKELYYRDGVKEGVVYYTEWP